MKGHSCFQATARPVRFGAAPSGMARGLGRLAAFSNYKDLHPSLFLHRPFNLPPTSLRSNPLTRDLRPLFPRLLPIAQPSHLAWRWPSTAIESLALRPTLAPSSPGHSDARPEPAPERPSLHWTRQTSTPLLHLSSNGADAVLGRAEGLDALSLQDPCLAMPTVVSPRLS